MYLSTLPFSASRILLEIFTAQLRTVSPYLGKFLVLFKIIKERVAKHKDSLNWSNGFTVCTCSSKDPDGGPRTSQNGETD